MSDCIEWTGYRDKDGYGSRKWKGKTRLVHRVAWEEEHGPIPPGMKVCHSCDNPPCYNVEHLFLGTHQENMDDRNAKGRCAVAHGEANPNARITQAQVDALRAEYVPKRNGGVVALAKKYGISKSQVHNILTGASW